MRNSVLQIQQERSDHVDVRVELTRDTFNEIFDGALTHEQASDRGAAKVSGDERIIEAFIAVTDRPDELPTPHIALRWPLRGSACCTEPMVDVGAAPLCDMSPVPDPAGR